MPEIVPDRVGQLFYHRDTRLRTKAKHPVIVKSVDATDLRARLKHRQLRFDYGYGGDGRLYVELSIYRPAADRPYILWLHQYFDVKLLIDSDARQEELARVAKTLGISQMRLKTAIVALAPWRDVSHAAAPRPPTAEDLAAFGLLVTAIRTGAVARN